MNMRPFLISLFALLWSVSGCNQDPTSSDGFRLPDGDANQGREVFLYMQCNECHTIKGLELPVIQFADPPYVELGGRVATVKTYGDLVTSIINPSHKISGYAKSAVNIDAFGDSNMRIYNDVMTVQQLIDLTTYLETTYDVIKPAVAPMYGP